MERLLLTRHISPEIINRNVLSEKLTVLAHQAQLQKKVLAVTEEVDVFNCPVSFGTFQNLTLRVVVHIPAMNALDEFTSFDYLTVPFPLADKFYQIFPDFHQLLVRDDRQHYSFISVNERRKCTSYSNFLACPQYLSLIHI